MEEIVDRAFVGLCEFCGEKIFTGVTEGRPPAPPISENLFARTYYTCDECGKLMCRNCLGKREGILKKKFYCPDCFKDK